MHAIYPIKINFSPCGHSTVSLINMTFLNGKVRGTGHPLTLSIFKQSESNMSVLPPIESYPLNFTMARDDPQRYFETV
jgi:hypothetical protein